MSISVDFSVDCGIGIVKSYHGKGGISLSLLYHHAKNIRSESAKHPQ
jgi:hypothetical protein